MLRIKIEMNTFETSPARSHVRLPFSVASPLYFTGGAEVLTFDPHELVATKLRALYQRRKGRDLFDLWLALTEMGLDPSEVLGSFEPYRPERGYTAAAAVETMRGHLADVTFRNDLSLLVASWPKGYDVDTAGELIIERLLSRV